MQWVLRAQCRDREALEALLRHVQPSLRRYLREFLLDPRVIELPRVLWWTILHLFVSWGAVLVFLLVKPSGLFGRREVRRV